MPLYGQLAAQFLPSDDAEIDKIMKTDGAGGWLLVDAPAEAFGAELITAESESQSSTTSSTYQFKLNLTTVSLPLGNYYLSFQWVVGGSANNTQIDSRLQLNNTTDIQQLIVFPGNANGRQSISGHKVFFGISGVQSFDIDFRKSSGSGTANCVWARLSFWRIS